MKNTIKVENQMQNKFEFSNSVFYKNIIQDKLMSKTLSIFMPMTT